MIGQFIHHRMHAAGTKRGPAEVQTLPPPYDDIPDLIEWYEALNGYGNPESIEVLPGWYFCELKRSVADLDLSDKHRTEDRYSPSMLLLTDGSDGGCAVLPPCHASGPKVVVREIHDTWNLGFADIKAVVATALECHKRGVWADPSEPDWDTYEEIARALNPGMGAWSS